MEPTPSCGHCCGTCGGCGGGHGCGQMTEIVLDRFQARLLSHFLQTPFLPLCHLPSAEAPWDALPLFLPQGDESLEELSAIAHGLEALAELRLITLDAQLPLGGCDYREYRTSTTLQALIPQGEPAPSELEGRLTYGSMALTALGQVVLEQLSELL